MKHILLIEPNHGLWGAGKFTRHSSFEPLGIEYIGSFLEREGYKIRILQQRSIDEYTFLEQILSTSPDVVGFSVMTYNANITRWFCKKIKENNKRIVTVVGGYHPSGAPEIVEDENIDFAVIGEGEVAFLELIKSLENSNDSFKKVKGIAYWDNGLRINQKQDRVVDIDSLPFPKRSLEILQDCKVNTLAYPSPSQQISVAQVTHTRGCPYSCTFCVSPVLWGRLATYRSPENVVAEIKYLHETFGTNFIFFSDLTFNLNKKRVVALCQEIIKNKLNINWFCMCYIELFDQELAELMSKAGCTKIAFGIETFSNSVIEKIKPQASNNIKKMHNKLQMCQDLGMFTRGYFMIGHPYQNSETIEDTITLLKKLPIDELKMSFITPFPGTQLAVDLNSRLLTNNYDYFTTNEPVVGIDKFTPDELNEIRERIFEEFYNSEEYKIRMRNKIKKFPYLKQSYDEFLFFLKEKEIIREYSEILYDI